MAQFMKQEPINNKNKEVDVMDRCINCGQDLSEGVYTAPWEDGDNEYGYVICPHCRTKNIDWTSGDDE